MQNLRQDKTRFRSYSPCVICMVGVLSASLALADDQPPAAKTLSTEQRVRLLELPRAYAAARDDLEQKAEVVREAVELGPLAVQRLRPVVEKEFHGAQTAYQKAYLDELKRVKPDALETLEPQALIDASKRLPALRARLLPLGEMSDSLSAETASPEGMGEAPRRAYADRLAASERDTITEARNAVALAQLDRDEVTAIIETNKQRVAHGLPPLQVDQQLCLAAADHSRDMENLDFFSHTSPVPGKQSFTDRAKRFGANASAENIARTGGGGAEAVKMWMESEGHRANILNPGQRRIGVGRAGASYTQLFGR